MGEAWKQWEGQVVNGEFPLRQYLGGSELSAVFLTEHGKPEVQRAAIKLIPADPGTAELHLSRWRFAAKLSHPHLVGLFDMGRCRLGDVELLYIVMEHAEEDLSQILPHRPLTPAEARDMLEPVLDALAYVHREGFVHAHIKPANIMAVQDQLKISSDGLCRMDQATGSPARPSIYDAPETAGGRLSPAGDVWSLGMTLTEALTQRLPVWEGTEAEQPVLPEPMPAPFLDIARHCLRRDPQRRWTLADIAARLGQPLPLPRVQTTARPQGVFAKWRYIVPAVAAALALLAGLVGPRLLKRRPEPQPAPSVAKDQRRVPSRPEQGPATSRTGQSTPRTTDSRQSASSSTPSPTILRSGAGAKTPTGRLIPGEVLQQVIPDVPPTARATIRGTVRVSVRVAVDRSANVVGATLDSPGPSRYFANLAVQAARRWEFAPPKIDGAYVSSEWILRFEFMNTTTKVRSVQAVP